MMDRAEREALDRWITRDDDGFGECEELCDDCTPQGWCAYAGDDEEL